LPPLKKAASQVFWKNAGSEKKNSERDQQGNVSFEKNGVGGCLAAGAPTKTNRSHQKMSVAGRVGEMGPASRGNGSYLQKGRWEGGGYYGLGKEKFGHKSGRNFLQPGCRSPMRGAHGKKKLSAESLSTKRPGQRIRKWAEKGTDGPGKERFAAADRCGKQLKGRVSTVQNKRAPVGKGGTRAKNVHAPGGLPPKGKQFWPQKV